jgi:UDP-N-acetylglucosamine acyltransferase
MNQIGKNNSIGQYVLLGASAEIKPEIPKANTEGCRIGNDNVIRDMVTIHERTSIGDRNYILTKVHICHDCQIGNDNIISAGAILGGHVKIHDGVNIGLNASFHQYVTVGAYSMIGMGAVVIEDIPPFVKVVGCPARIIGYNEVGMQRAGFTPEQIQRYKLGQSEYQTWFNTTHKRKIMKWKHD